MDNRYAQGCLTAHLDETGQWIRLRVDGDWQADLISASLRHLTALPKATKDGTGEVKVPKTWAMVTQCAKLMEEKDCRWNPQPDLNAWIFEEFMRRHDEGGALTFDVSGMPEDRVPMPHQAAGAYIGAVNRRFFFADDAGTGKTMTALLTLAELEARGLDPFPAMVVTPASVTDQWIEELEQVFPEWPAAVYAGGKRRSLSSRYRLYVMSWDVFRIDMQYPRKPVLDIDGNPMVHEKTKRPVTEEDRSELPPLLKFLVPKTLILDEAHALCATASATLQTPTGPKRIFEVREGDAVLGVDHVTGLDVWTTVRKAGTSPLRPTVKLGLLEVTSDHPVWVSHDGCIAYATNYDQDVHLLPLRSILPAEVVPELASPEVLRQDLRVRLAAGILGAEGSVRAGNGSQPGIGSLESVPGIGAQPVQGTTGSSDSGELENGEQEAWVSGAEGRQRGAYYPAGAVAEATRLGVHPRVLSQPGSAATGLPDVLQAGSRVPSPETRCGAGREFAPLEVPASTGCQEGRETEVTWLDGAAGPEQGSPYGYLWNLATDTGNYVASGILIHNCNVKTKQSVAARRMARVAEFAFPMSGTPITRDVGGFWSALNVLDIRSFPDQERYKERYTDRYSKAYGPAEVEGISSAHKQEFFTLMQGSMRHVSKLDVLKDLPPKTYSTRIIQVPGAFRAAYDEMAEDMIAHLPDTDEPLEVMSTLAQLQRLSQLASSACDVEVRMETDENPKSATFGELVRRYHVTMREPSWKVDELMQVMDEMQGQPLITFTPHTQLLKIAGARAEKQGYRVGYIIGGQVRSKRTAIRRSFQAGELDLLCCNTAAGGVGLNLTRASTVCFLERPWAYWQASQNEDRVHRRGQSEQVHIIDIVAANTVESRVREALKDKAAQLADLVRDPRIVNGLLGGQPLRIGRAKSEG